MPKFKIRVIQHIVESKAFSVEADSLEAALALNPDAFAPDIGSADFDEVKDRWIEKD